MDLNDNISIFEQSSPESLRARAQLSPHLARSELHDLSDEQTFDNDYTIKSKPAKSCTSNRSSISSFPGSVIHTVPFTDTENAGFGTPLRSESFERTKAATPNYLSAFRNPSSVRALQLESECADSDTASRNDGRRSPRL